MICRWPGNPEERWDFSRTKFWDMNDKAQGGKDDSCVTLYWNPKVIQPKERRALAFTYGLGKVSSIDTRNAELALTCGGRPIAGGEFTVTAWVKNAKAGQKVKLALPPEMSLKDAGAAEQSVADGISGLAQISWKVRVNPGTKEGFYEVGAESGSVKEKLKVVVVTNAKKTDPLVGLEGVWQAEVTINGAPFPAVNGGLTFQKDMVTRKGILASVPQGLALKMESENGTFTSKGKTIDLKFPIGTLAGIYEIEGSTAKVAYYLSGQRPTDFTTVREGDFLVVHKLKRVR